MHEHSRFTRRAPPGRLPDEIGDGPHVATATPEQALLLLDINDFQSVNDAFGTDVGDSVLQVIAHRLLVRTGPGTVVGTLGGDRFGVLAEVCSGSSAVGLGQELLALVASPIRVHSYDVAMTGVSGSASWSAVRTRHRLCCGTRRRPFVMPRLRRP